LTPVQILDRIVTRDRGVDLRQGRDVLVRGALLVKKTSTGPSAR
jgi:hypothetical protein